MTDIKIIKDKISLDELKDVASQTFGDMVKAVVDVEKDIMAVGAGMHVDEEALLLSEGSKQENLWGINIFVNQPREEWVQFDSMINIRPWQNNRSMGVDDKNIRNSIIKIVNKLV